MTTDLPDDLLKAVVRKRLVVFAGSGASAPTGRPTWKPFMSALVGAALKRGMPSSVADGLNELMQLSNDIAHVKLVPQVVRSALRMHLRADGENTYFECISVALSDYRAAPASSYHRLLLNLRPRCVLTTNYDPCFEVASAESGGGWYPMVIQELPGDWETSGLLSSVIYHVHGSQAAGKERTMVLSLKDYGELYRENNLAARFLRQAFSSSNLLFFGASMNDEEILAEFYDHMEAGPHWALVAKNSKEAALFRAMGVVVVEFDYDPGTTENGDRANYYGAEQVLSQWAIMANQVLSQPERGVAG